jgi:uncharacterized protein YecT (DUF1311 family)
MLAFGGADATDNAPSTAQLRESYASCVKTSGGNMAPMKTCMDDEFAYQDERLNTVYKRLMNMIDTGDQARL